MMQIIDIFESQTAGKREISGLAYYHYRAIRSFVAPRLLQEHAAMAASKALASSAVAALRAKQRTNRFSVLDRRRQGRRRQVRWLPSDPMFEGLQRQPSIQGRSPTSAVHRLCQMPFVRGWWAQGISRFSSRPAAGFALCSGGRGHSACQLCCAAPQWLACCCIASSDAASARERGAAPHAATVREGGASPQGPRLQLKTLSVAAVVFLTFLDIKTPQR